MPYSDEEINFLRNQACVRGARLQLLREWMRETDWLLFCADYPDAHTWFDSHGVPQPTSPPPKVGSELLSLEYLLGRIAKLEDRVFKLEAMGAAFK